MFPAVWPSENGGREAVAYRVKAVFQTASSAVIFAESDFRHEGCKAAAGLFLGKQPFAIAEIVTGLRQPAGAPTSVMAMRQRFEARGIFRLPLETFAETLAKCQPAPSFGKIGLRVKWRYHQAAGQPIPSCPVLLLLGVIVRAAGSRQIQPRSRYLDVQNWKYRSLFYLFGDGMIFQTASRFECCIYPAQ